MSERRSAEIRVVAGLSCAEVLGRLSAFVDGDLEEGEVAAMRAHVSGCDTCASFGGCFAAAVNELRAAPPEPLDPAIGERLRAALGLGRAPM